MPGLAGSAGFGGSRGTPPFGGREGTAGGVKSRGGVPRGIGTGCWLSVAERKIIGVWSWG